MKKLLSILASVLMVLAILTPVSADEKSLTCDSPEAVACIGNDGYSSLGDAIDVAADGAEIDIVKDIDDAEGISVAEGKSFTIDFNDHVYTIIGPGAGSTGTETNAFQLLKDSTITFKNGTIKYGSNVTQVKRIIQNYADLTLDNMTFYSENQVGGEDYALSFNNGKIVFKGNTSIYTSSSDVIAFDVCKFSSYPSANVLFDDSYTGTIEGKILYDTGDSTTHSLTIKGNGNFDKIEKSASTVTEKIEIYGGTFEDADALKYIKEDAEVKIVLDDDYNEDVVIPEGANVTIDLNGHSITNVSDHTILNKGTLTIEGEGTIDNVSHGKAALFNDVNATAVLNGGNYTRSEENGQSSTESGGNSYYNIVNHGSMTINDGVTVEQDGHFSSMIENGWYDGSQRPEGSDDPVLVINGGTFNGGLNTVKNDDYGVLTINGGEFSNVTQATVLNWNEATINDGVFVSEGSAILNGFINDTMDKGTLVINGGSFSSKGDSIVSMQGESKDLENVTVAGGTFVADGKVDESVKAFMDQDLVLDENGNVRVDNSELQDLYDKYVAEKLNKEDFTADSWTVYEKALVNAEAVLADVDATKDEITSAKEALTKAHEALTVKTEEPVIKAPVITSGNNSSWNTNSSDGLTFTSDAEYDDFLKVLVDDKEVDNKYYTVKEGSTIVTLSNDFLKTLSVGKHTLSIVSVNGTATATFTIEAAAVTVPDTGITTTITYLLPTTIILASGIILTALLKKRYSK